MDIRPITLEDLPAYQIIASRSFARGAPVEIKPEEFMRDDRVRIGAFEGGRLQAQYTILDYHLHFGTDRRPCGGIASVACEPSARGRGYAGALIDRSLEMMRDSGQYCRCSGRSTIVFTGSMDGIGRGLSAATRFR